MPFDPDAPFNDLPLLPPKAELETKAVLRKAIAANKALAELKGAGELIPNQGVLINAIVLQEAKLSSEIENVVTTKDELYRGSPALRAYVRETNLLWEYVEKNRFLDISRKHVQTRRGHLLGVAGLCFGAIFKSRQIARLWRDSSIAPPTGRSEILTMAHLRGSDFSGLAPKYGSCWGLLRIAAQ